MSRTAATLKAIFDQVQPDMERVEARLRAALVSDHPFVRKLVEHSGKLQGKRVRPILLLHVAHILGGVKDVHISLGASVELLHSASLVHDDVLDDAAVRRKERTLNDLWGNETSILFGDLLFAKAYSLCLEVRDHEANRILSKTVEEMCMGEIIQMSSKFDCDMDEARYFKAIEYKTAALFDTACRMGGVGTGAAPETVEALARYGRCLGVAFQIVDDCLDLTGDESEVGKSLGTDLNKGKFTLPVIKLMRELPPAQCRDLREILSSTKDADRRRSVVMEMIKERSVLKESLKRAAECVEEAKAGLRRLPASAYLDNLHTLADFVLDRRS